MWNFYSTSVSKIIFIGLAGPKTNYSTTNTISLTLSRFSFRMGSVYLDYNATTPLDPYVVSRIAKSLSEDWANPSSSHNLGQKAKCAIELARKTIANALNCAAENVTFTSGGTEALNWTLFSLRHRASKSHVVSTMIEHCAAAKPLKVGHLTSLFHLLLFQDYGKRRIY